MPCFIDESGTRCAVAHLLEVSGQGELAESIARGRTYARVRELADDERVRAWLDATGITLEEAARIQPSYCFITLAAVCLCQFPAPTLAEGVVVGLSDGSVSTSVRIDRIEGAPTSIKVGDVVSVYVSNPSDGARVLLVVRSVDDAGPPLEYQLGVDVSDTAVTCSYDDFTRTHPIPKDVAYEAVLTNDGAACENRLAQLDPTWKRSKCDDAAPAPPLPGCRCDVGRRERPTSIPALTTAGVLAALLRHRARRSEARKKSA